MTKGTYIHRHILIGKAAKLARNYEGVRTTEEFPVTMLDGLGRIDLLIDTDQWRLAWEAEMTARRVINDIEKAKAASATWLYIVVPNYKVLRAAKRAFHRSGIGKTNWIFLSTFGLAMKRLRHCLDESFIARGQEKERKNKP